LNACSDNHDDCNACPEEQMNKCVHVHDILIDKIHKGR
jgi:hypothetical protein